MNDLLGRLSFLDIAIIFLFFVVIFLISLFYTRKAGKSLNHFFLSDRKLPWYLAGTAMVATTFAADTPLAVTELVAQNGVAGNWLWWNMAIGGMLTVFFFARLWRRAGIFTDLELIEFRYSGKPASILRGFRAIYLGLFMNCIVLGWVHKAMEKIFSVVLPGFDPFLLVVILAVIIALYASASGLIGTVRTDSFQFLFAMIGCIILAVIVIRLPAINNTINLQQLLPSESFRFFPALKKPDAGTIGTGVLSLSLGAFFAYIGIQWWSSWYPGADPGGGGYVAQRMLSAKDERHSFLATLWFTIAHYTIRPWPWIIVALVALVILPRADSIDDLKNENLSYFERAEKIYKGESKSTTSTYLEPEFVEYYEKYENTIDPGVMYPKLMVQYLPAGLLGLLIAVFMAAYMSTISAQLNWGTSYIINDFYKRFVNSSLTEKQYVLLSRITIVLLMAFSLFITKYFLSTISGAWIFILNASAGIGLVLILRWYWWRINAWSEISAMIAPLIFYPAVRFGFNIEPPFSLYPVVAGSTIIWVLITYLTKPENEQTLFRFYEKVKPGGKGWSVIAARLPGVNSVFRFPTLFINWILGILAIYSAMYGIGQIIFMNLAKGFIAIAITFACSYIIFRNSK
ncbi:sodium:solute symporter family protein [Bacteroidota bacterium]